MQIKRLKILGFKSFVDPTELAIEPGLTGVVGPNGCGKSNLLEALRWVMGETSYKSMRASSMEDVIFSGTDFRPARNNAQVTIILDNSGRTAPAEFNDHDEIEITRHIEIEQGSLYRVNGREVRARDIKLLFEDASTGARSHALVRQGQIGEIVNSKPQTRRRILEDAAGIAGLHSRRHEAEMRLRGAETNLARLNDLMGQLTTQVNSLKRQARQAKKYKTLSSEIRKSEALQHFLSWTGLCAMVEREEEKLSEILGTVTNATTSETKAIRAHAEAADDIKPLRDEEARRAAALQRLKIEEETLDREAEAATRRQRELAARIEQLENDIEREKERSLEARNILERLKSEEQALQKNLARSGNEELAATEARDKARQALNTIEHEYARHTETLAELKAEHRKFHDTVSEQVNLSEDLKNQLAEVNARITELSSGGADKATLRDLQDTIKSLTTRTDTLELEAADAETFSTAKRADLETARDQFETARLNLRQITTEIQTLTKVLHPDDNPDYPPVLEELEVEAGYETALGAALGEDLEASTKPDAPASWRKTGVDKHPAPLPGNAKPLLNFVSAPGQIHPRLSQIGVIDAELGAELQSKLVPGQRLVSKEGDLWRWDGFTARADAPLPAAIRLVEKNRLIDLKETEKTARSELEKLEGLNEQMKRELLIAETSLSELRTNWRIGLSDLGATKEHLSQNERAARETNEKLAALTEAGLRLGGSLEATATRHSQALENIAALAPLASSQSELDATYKKLLNARTKLYEVEQALTKLQQGALASQARLKAIADELTEWTRRGSNSDDQVKSFSTRLTAANEERAAIDNHPAEIQSNREKLLDELTKSEATRQVAADKLATAENHLLARDRSLRSTQATLSEARENKARTEAHLDGARQRRTEQARLIRETLDCAPEDCLVIAEYENDGDLPELSEVERKLHSLKSERDRLGGVNLRAEDELSEITGQFDDVESERVDLEEAIAKLRTGISQLNSEGRKRLLEAFDEVNEHFKKLFTTLFGGGTAELQLIESDDPLESGLEILARPPGKKPNVMSLLSGGEQALTAMSLIFAVFLTSPSPICVLDEVDAPLDDSNVDRYCNMIEEIARSTDTRFLVITHHPVTMARMRRLFGVTMSEKGISQLVSVDLKTAEQFREAS